MGKLIYNWVISDFDSDKCKKEVNSFMRTIAFDEKGLTSLEISKKIEEVLNLRIL